jgi:twitching motility protein PilT
VAVSLHQLLKTMTEMGGTDLHITTNSAPQIRVDGKLRPLDLPPLSPVETKQLAYSVLTDAQKHRFEENLELDFSFGIKGLARYRANVFMQRGAVAACYRTIPYEIRGFKELGLPPVVAGICDKPRGLVLVTGPTGSGKSTTLAAMLDKINSERHEHMLTVEDPIEYLHQHKKCVVNQREVHSDTHSFANSLRAALREDPDVVLIGEMRDLETIESALRIAETGHLTFATLHTNSASQTINRIVDVFPAHQQSQVRAQLSLVLEGIMCQALLPRASGSRPQPDPRGQDPPDLLDDADRTGEVRDADVQPGPGQPLLRQADHAADRPRHQLEPRGAAGHDQPRCRPRHPAGRGPCARAAGGPLAPGG